MSTIPNDCIFKAKTKEAFVIKKIGELLNNTLKFAPFRVTEDGIFILKADSEKEVMEQLIDISLFRENFDVYKCKTPINFSVNTKHFYKLLTIIKKKDLVTLFIRDLESMQLGICVQSDEYNRVVTYMRICATRPDEIIRPEGYSNPIIITSKDFQKMKNLNNISTTINVTSKPEYIRFYCDGGELYSRELVIGNSDSCEEEDCKVYKQDFKTSHITSLTKCASQSGNVQVFVHEDLGMKIKMNASNLGEIIVYIKSTQMIEDENPEKDVQTDEDQSDVEEESRGSQKLINQGMTEEAELIDEYQNNSSSKKEESDEELNENLERLSVSKKGSSGIKKSESKAPIKRKK
jgi:hypothetical protein